MINLYLINLYTYIWYCFWSWNALSSSPPPMSVMNEIYVFTTFTNQFYFLFQKPKIFVTLIMMMMMMMMMKKIPGMMRKVPHHWHQSLKDLEGGRSLKSSKSLCITIMIIIIIIILIIFFIIFIIMYHHHRRHHCNHYIDHIVMVMLISLITVM